jgi:CRISPR-associated protein Csm1
MTTNNELDASSRVALAALLHDLGKFAERARIDVERERLETWKQLDCPHWDGRPSHIHAAYTTAGWMAIEPCLPSREAILAAPFAGPDTPDADDSLINAAARHHRPDTFLQWIIATADRLASGFERSEFDTYNKAAEGTRTGRNHYQARLLSLFDAMGLDQDRRDAHAWCQPLAALSAKSLFPVERAKYEPGTDQPAQEEYKTLWQSWLTALEQIPASHRANLPLWLDHLDAAFLAHAHAIPSATAGNTRPDVSLYDHSKAVSALAVALWRWHDETARTGPETVVELRERADWDEPKFLLVQGDFTGIQDFIFAEGGETQRQAARLLRGRSFQVALLSELAALTVLEALDLPPTSQIVNAAGKCLIVAPNTDATRAALEQVQARLNDWFLEHTFGESAYVLAWEPAACNDFLQGRFANLMKRLFESLEVAKLRRFDLTRQPAGAAIHAADFSQGACAFDGHRPAQTTAADKPASLLAADQIALGRWLADKRMSRLLVTRASAEVRESGNVKPLGLDYFGYRVAFASDEEASGRFGPLAESGELLRCWDFSLPGEDAAAALFHGYARRDINAYVPVFDPVKAEWEAGKYGKWQEEVDLDREVPVKTLNHLACEDKLPRGDDLTRWQGLTALAVLKGDVDNLGSLFQRGIQPPTFAKMAALSRQMNAFFAVYLPWLCQHRPEFRDTYTVFAGGDDFFLIGPWHKTQRLARQLAEDFARYVAHNPEIHFSAGITLAKPGVPIRALAEAAEAALDAAKQAGKNRVTCHRVPVTWERYDRLAEFEDWLSERYVSGTFSTGFIYRLLALAEKAASPKPEDAIWQSWLAYRVRRFVVERLKLASEAARTAAQAEIAGRLRDELMHGKLAVTIPIANTLYRYRD